MFALSLLVLLWVSFLVLGLTGKVPNIDDIARWIGQPSSDPEPSGVYEGGGTGGVQQDFVGRDALLAMPKARVYRVSTRSLVQNPTYPSPVW